MNIWFGLALGVAIGSPIIALLFGVGMLDTKKAHDEDWYLVGIAGCVIIGILFVIIGCCVRHKSDVTLYDVEIRVHYVDGYTEIIREDSIRHDELPIIIEDVQTSHYGGAVWSSESLGTYSLYLGGKQYPAVIRFEYLKKREYKVPYKELYAY